MKRASGEIQVKSDTLRDARVVFTGRLASMTRREAQALVRELGGAPVTSISGRTTHLVIGMHGWPLRADGSVSAKLQQAERRRERRGGVRIISEVGFLELAGLRAREPDVRKSYPLDAVADLVDVPARTIERWEYLGLVRSRDGAYDFQDIVSLRTIASLVGHGVPVTNIRRSLDALASFLPGTDRPLAQLTIVASDSGELLAQHGDALVAPDGQQLLDFTPRPAPDEPEAAILHRAPIGDADALFEHAVWLEDEERYEEAADVYRQAIALEPGRSELYYNFGNVLRMSGNENAAEELYRIALAMDPGNELAWYNLADLQEAADRIEEAITSLESAIDACPTYADGHFNLASCLERIGARDAARASWLAYLRLDSTSEWAQIAREHLAPS
ncbi:MAG: tetratricopeptide repeat protein [Planctomycetes bacterium]|nr:tetratricopeptide repeat protein [Planctomycetota bacterium]